MLAQCENKFESAQKKLQLQCAVYNITNMETLSVSLSLPARQTFSIRFAASGPEVPQHVQTVTPRVALFAPRRAVWSRFPCSRLNMFSAASLPARPTCYKWLSLCRGSGPEVPQHVQTVTCLRCTRRLRPISLVSLSLFALTCSVQRQPADFCSH